MTPEQFEEIFEKVKQEANLVQTLRTLVFNLATTGKLTDREITKNEVKNLGSCVELIMGQAPRGESCNSDGNGTMFVKVGEFGSLYPREINWTTEPKKHAKSGDVLICVVGATIGKLNLGVDCAIGRSVASIRPDPNLDSKFLYYSLQPYSLSLRENAQGTAQGVIGKEDLNAIEIWLPPLEEQRRIVSKVDELMALCDELEITNQKTNRTKLTYLKSLTKNISDGALNKDKQAILASAFAKAPKNTEGIQELKKVCINFGIQMDQQSGKENETVFEKLQELTGRMKVDKLLPKSFLIRQLESELFSTLSNLSLGSIAFIEKGKTGIKSAEPGEYPLVVTAAERKTCKSYDFETDAAIVPLVSSTGHGHASIKRLHFQSGRFALGTILAAVIPFEEELFFSRFIYEYLTTFKKELLVSRMTGTANVTLSVSKIEEVPIPIISSKTQKWICDFCKICDQLAISYKKESSIQDDLLKKLIA